MGNPSFLSKYQPTGLCSINDGFLNKKQDVRNDLQHILDERVSNLVHSLRKEQTAFVLEKKGEKDKKIWSHPDSN